MAKRDTDGNLVTTKTKLKNIYKMTYVDRLTQNEINPQFTMLFKWKDILCDKRLEVARYFKTNQCIEKDICEVLKKLKDNKARDSMNLVNEMFKPNSAGNDLVNSLVKMMTSVKSWLIAPDLMQNELIYSVYKNKGKKDDLNHDRGIFIMNIIRSIFDRLVYKDEYPIIDENMSKCNVGSRKRRNHRNNLFILYAIMNEVVRKNKCIDLQI